jgi:hypothetical protein
MGHCSLHYLNQYLLDFTKWGSLKSAAWFNGDT